MSCRCCGRAPGPTLLTHLAGGRSDGAGASLGRCACRRARHRGRGRSRSRTGPARPDHHRVARHRPVGVARSGTRRGAQLGRGMAAAAHHSRPVAGDACPNTAAASTCRWRSRCWPRPVRCRGRRWSSVVLFGELGLDGRVRPIRGVLPAAMAAAAAGFTRVIVPLANAAEATLVPDLDVWSVGSLSELVVALRSGRAPGDARARSRDGPTAAAAVPSARAGSTPSSISPTCSGNRRAGARSRSPRPAAITPCCSAIRAPARRCWRRGCPACCPMLDRAAALEVTAVHSIAGVLPGDCPLVTRPPFRDPHHTTSVAALVGGGSGMARPGLASLAHHGVLFLDEAPEFAPGVLDALRQPLESGHVSIARAGGVARYPARFLLVLAANPCGCATSSAAAGLVHLFAADQAALPQPHLRAAARPRRPAGADGSGEPHRIAGRPRSRRAHVDGRGAGARRAVAGRASAWPAARGARTAMCPVANCATGGRRHAPRSSRPNARSTPAGCPHAASIGCCGCRGRWPTSAAARADRRRRRRGAVPAHGGGRMSDRCGGSMLPRRRTDRRGCCWAASPNPPTLRWRKPSSPSARPKRVRGCGPARWRTAGLVNLRARLAVARPERDLAAGALSARASSSPATPNGPSNSTTWSRSSRGDAGVPLGLWVARARATCGTRADGRSLSSERARRRRTATTLRANSASASPSGCGPSFRAAPTASTAPRIEARSPATDRRSRCSPAASTSPTRAGTPR